MNTLALRQIAPLFRWQPVFRPSSDDLEQEIHNALLDYFQKKPAYRDLKGLGSLKATMFETLQFNRACDWNSGYENVALVSSAADYLNVMALRARRYQDAGYDQLYQCAIPGLDYDEYDRHSLILFCKHEGLVVATERIIVKSAGELLPAEKIYDAHKGLGHINERTRFRKQTYAEKSRLAIASDTPIAGQFFKKLFASTYYLALHQKIGNYIALTTAREYSKNYHRFGMIAEKTGHFFKELTEPDVILSWDLDLQVSAFFERAILDQSKSNQMTTKQSVAA